MKAGDLSFELVDPKVLRVCADPRNLPFSNEKGEGFENKLAELFADKLQKKLDYMFFPQATGFVRMTLGSHRCDVIMGFPQGDDLVQGTNPYYRTAYALVAKTGGGLEEVDTLEDARLKGKHIGIVAGTPPATNMAANGLDGECEALSADDRHALRHFGGGHDRRSHSQARSTPAFSGDRWRASTRKRRPAASCHAAGEGNHRAATGLSHRHGRARRRPELEAAAQPADPGKPAGEINKILLDFGVPLLDENDRPLGAETAKDAMMRRLAGVVAAPAWWSPVAAHAAGARSSPRAIAPTITARRCRRRSPARAC